MTSVLGTASAAAGARAMPNTGDTDALREERITAALAELGADLDEEQIEDAIQGRCEWPEPRPIRCELRPVAPFNAEVLLPPALGDWIADEAERMPCPVDFVAAAAIVTLGSLIGARCAIKPKARDSWLVVPNLWGAIVGDPSAKKSPAWGAAVRPLDMLVAKALEQHEAESGSFQCERMVHEARIDALKAQLKKAAKDGKESPASVAAEIADLEEPTEPVLRRYKTNDSTVEKLGEILRDNPHGVLVLRDELVGLISNWEREGREGDRAFFLEAWNGNQSFDTDRIGRGHVRIENVCVSIFGGTQPDKLIGYLEQASDALANDGMLQRFQVIVFPDHRRWEWRDRSPNREAREAAYSVFEKLADLDPVALGASPPDDLAKFPYFRFSPEAQEIFIEWSTDLHRERIEREDSPIMRQHLAKYDKLFPALALILHLVDAVANGVTGPVSAAAALRAAAWCEHLESHARRCYGMLADAGQRAAQTLADRLKRGMLPNGFTARDVRLKGWKHLGTDEAIGGALGLLEAGAWVRPEANTGSDLGGRPTVRYRINPRVLAEKVAS